MGRATNTYNIGIQNCFEFMKNIIGSRSSPEICVAVVSRKCDAFRSEITDEVVSQ